MTVLVRKFDVFIMLFINKYLRNKYLDIFMCIMTKLGNMGAVWIAIAIYSLMDKQYRYEGKVVLSTLIISTIIGEGVLKNLIKRSRPFDAEKNVKLLITKPISYSFPSGHALSSFAVAGVLSVYFAKYELIFIGLAFFIAISRIYLCVHYTTDVIGGIAIGLICSKFILVVLNFK
ncbi:phosphatase PAP2 family protein [Clostridium sp. Mt-5]|uniref:Phosphatase PAP2 family protein n=1 Tax=Clostridium moutaii TaxID=3240932 RepID=A0ABV4BS31_9CLOT